MSLLISGSGSGRNGVGRRVKKYYHNCWRFAIQNMGVNSLLEDNYSVLRPRNQQLLDHHPAQMSPIMIPVEVLTINGDMSEHCIQHIQVLTSLVSSPCCLCPSHIALYKDERCFLAAELNILSNALKTARCPILAPSSSSGRGQPNIIVVGRKEDEIS